MPHTPHNKDVEDHDDEDRCNQGEQEVNVVHRLPQVDVLGPECTGITMTGLLILHSSGGKDITVEEESDNDHDSDDGPSPSHRADCRP